MQLLLGLLLWAGMGAGGQGRAEAGGPLVAHDLQRPKCLVYTSPAQPFRVKKYIINIFRFRTKHDIYVGCFRKDAVCLLPWAAIMVIKALAGRPLIMKSPV